MHVHRGRTDLSPSGADLAVATDAAPDVGGPATTSALAMPAFFAGWIGVGVVLALLLARRGHDRRLMLALGIGLGPLMGIIAVDALRRRERSTPRLVLAPGTAQGGDLDVLVLVEGGPDAVAALAPTLQAIAPELGTVTLARVVDHEWLEDDEPNAVVEEAKEALATAGDLLPVDPALIVLPGTAEEATRTFRDRPGPSLVLVAVDGTGPRRRPQ